MKKSKLKNIIKESIKELITEQTNPTQLAGGNCDGAVVHNLPYDGTYFTWGQQMIDTHGPTADFSKLVFHGPPGLLGPSYPSNVCMHSNGYIYEYRDFAIRHPNNFSNNQYFNSYTDLINGINAMPWASITYNTSMTFTDVAQQVTDDNCTPSSSCYQVGLSGRRFCNHCTNTPANQNPPEIWKCIKQGKFPKCIKYSTAAGVPQSASSNISFPGFIGPYYSKAECIESGCEGIGPDDEDLELEPFSPLTTDPQSMVTPGNEFGSIDEPIDKITAGCVTDADCEEDACCNNGICEECEKQSLDKFIKEEIIRLSELDYPAPPEILNALKEKLKMDPLIRFVDKLKALNSIPPAYRVFLLNGENFDIYYEDFSLMLKIGTDEYYINDMDERNYAIKHINRLLTRKSVPGFGDEEEDMEDMGGEEEAPPEEAPEEEV